MKNTFLKTNDFHVSSKRFIYEKTLEVAKVVPIAMEAAIESSKEWSKIGRELEQEVKADSAKKVELEKKIKEKVKGDLSGVDINNLESFLIKFPTFMEAVITNPTTPHKLIDGLVKEYGFGLSGICQDPDAPIYVLERVVAICKNTNVLWSVTQNINAPLSLLLKLSKLKNINHSHVLDGVMRHENMPVLLALGIFRDSSDKKIFYREQTLQKILVKDMNGLNPAVLIGFLQEFPNYSFELTENHSTPQGVLEYIALNIKSKTDYRRAEQIIYHPNSSPKTIQILADFVMREGDEIMADDIVQWTKESKRLAPQMISKLFEKFPYTARSAAANLNTPPELLKKLAIHKNEMVRDWAKSNPNFPTK